MLIDKMAFIINKEERLFLKKDNIAVAIEAIAKDHQLKLEDQEIKFENQLMIGENFAIEEILKGEEIISCGVSIGLAKETIYPGQAIRPGDKGNLEDSDFLKVEKVKDSIAENNPLDKNQYQDWFMGYKNANGTAGTENNVVIITTVECVNVLAENIAIKVRNELLDQYNNIDDVFSIKCPSGCGMPDGEPRNELTKILTQTMNNPNISKILLLGLGCEQISINPKFSNNKTKHFSEHVHSYDERVHTEVLQDYDDEIEAAEKIINGPLKKLLDQANQRQREKLPVSHLSLGLKCGGSDRFSAITSNPVLGHAADILIKHGGSVVITETPEFEGVLGIMASRTEDNTLKNWVTNLLKNFDELTKKYPIPASGHQKIAPGNLMGHLLNAKLKSAGAMLKCGSTQLVGGLEYLDNIHEKKDKGLYLLNGPSFDPISTTALGLSGCQIACFTTGLGTPIGSSLSQVIKLGNRPKIGLKNHVDFFSNGTLEGKTIQEVGAELYQEILDMASGKKENKVKSMARKYRKAGMPINHREFMIWKRWGDN